MGAQVAGLSEEARQATSTRSIFRFVEEILRGTSQSLTIEGELGAREKHGGVVHVAPQPATDTHPCSMHGGSSSTSRLPAGTKPAPQSG